VVQEGGEVILRIGKELFDTGANPNPICYLMFDSYYTVAKSREWLRLNGRRFSGSVRKNHFGCECRLVHGNNRDEPGDTNSIWNNETKELLTYYWDTQKGVGRSVLCHGGSSVQLKSRKVRRRNILFLVKFMLAF